MDGVEIEMRALRFRTRAGGEAEAGVVLEGLGVGLAVETRSCHVAKARDRGGGAVARAVVSDSQIGRAHV